MRWLHQPIPKVGRWLGSWCVGTSPTTPCPATWTWSGHSAKRSNASGSGRFDAVASATRRPGSGCNGWPTGGYRNSECCTPTRSRDLTLPPEAGAQCGSPARWDLCGGSPARVVPTTTSFSSAPRRRPRGARGLGPHEAWAGWKRRACERRWPRASLGAHRGTRRVVRTRQGRPMCPRHPWLAPTTRSGWWSQELLPNAPGRGPCGQGLPVVTPLATPWESRGSRPLRCGHSCSHCRRTTVEADNHRPLHLR